VWALMTVMFSATVVSILCGTYFFPDMVCILALRVSMLETGPIPLVSFSVKRLWILSEIHNWFQKCIVSYFSIKLTAYVSLIN
jgi:hypothetical protein